MSYFSVAYKHYLFLNIYINPYSSHCRLDGFPRHDSPPSPRVQTPPHATAATDDAATPTTRLPNDVPAR